MADGIEAKVVGIPDLRKELLRLPVKFRQRALLNALRAGARVVRDHARRQTPLLAAPVKRKGVVVRKPGTVRKAISVRTSKHARKSGDIGVFVNVKPLPGAKYKTKTTKGFFGGTKRSRVLVKPSQRGAYNPNDPFYWRWLNFGAKHMKGAGFLQAGASKLPEALSVITRTLGPAVQKILDRQASK